MDVEMYYEIGFGLFMIEAEAVEGGANIFSPYSTEQLDDSEY